MSAPVKPPGQPSTRFMVAAWAVFMGVLVGVALLALYLATRPILPAPDDSPSRPLPASTAAPAPLTPVVLTDLPAHQRGPQALHATTTSSETPR